MEMQDEQFFGLPYTGWGNERIKRDIDSLQEQMRELKEEIKTTNQNVTDQLRDLNAFVFQNVPAIVNYVNNGDFVFEQEDYVPGTNYAGDDQDCAHWYYKTSATAQFAAEHTTTVQSTDRIDTNPSRAAFWSKSTGEIVIGTSAKIGQPLVKNLAFPAGTLYCRFQIKKSGGGIVIPDEWRLRASIWDNTGGQSKIIEGQVFDLSASPANATPGAISRNYILRVETSMDFFYSDVLTPVQVNNQVSVDSIDNVNFVTVSWPVFPEAIAYKLYRKDSASNEWRQIAEIRNGATSFRDVGGRVGLPLFTPPVANILPRGQALFVNFGEFVTTTYQDVIFNIFIPSNYSYAATTGKQWIMIDMVDQDLNPVLMPDDALVIDKFALGYTNGRFTYSAQDLAAQASVTATAPPPVPPPGGEEGGGGGTPPRPGGGGGGGRGCVTPDTDILVTVDGKVELRNASDVKAGDCLVNIDGETSRVIGIIKGVTTRLYVITTDKNKQVRCSPSHRLMKCGGGGDEGELVCDLKVGDWVWVINGGYKSAEEITAIEIIDFPDYTNVLTFTLEEGSRTYVSNGIVSHNLKPILEL